MLGDDDWSDLAEMIEFVEMMNRLFVPMFALSLALQLTAGAVLAGENNADARDTGANDTSTDDGGGRRAAMADASATREPDASIGVGASADAGRRPHCLTALPDAAGGFLSTAAGAPRAEFPGRGRRDIGSAAFDRRSEQF